MADARAGLDAGHLGIFGTSADQSSAAAGNQQIDQTHRRHQLGRALAAGVLYQLHQCFRQPRRLQPLLHGCDDGVGRPKRLLAAAQHAGIAALDRQRRRVAGDVRAALVDNGHHAHRHAGLFDDQAVGALHPGNHAAHRIGQRRHLTDAFCHAAHALRVQLQAVEHDVGDMSLRRLQILRIGREDLFFAADQLIGHGAQRSILCRCAGTAQCRPCVACRFHNFKRRHAFFLPINLVPTGSPSRMR